jgi:hypothetical protein
MADPNSQHLKCLFCGHDDRKMTNEDLPSRWISEWLREDLSMDPKDSFPSQRDEKPPHGSRLLGTRIRDVCEDCNGTWMSDIQHEVRPILIPLMKPEQRRTPVSPDHQRLLGRWAYMSGLMLDRAISPPVLNSEFFTRFFKDRKPAPNVGILTAGFWAQHHPFWSGKAEIRDNGEHLGSILTFSVRYAVFQVVTLKPDVPGVRRPRIVDFFGQVIHPPTGATIGWPKDGRTLGDEPSLEKFARWLDDPRLRLEREV